jgi:hypothetical protein
MHDEFIREQIQSVAARDESEARTVIGRIAIACWPGGTADRIEPGALAWVRRWRPASAAAALPVCSCPAGRCAVCN